MSITPVFNEEDAKVLMEVKDVAQMQTFRRKFNAKFLHYTSEVLNNDKLLYFKIVIVIVIVTLYTV